MLTIHARRRCAHRRISTNHAAVRSPAAVVVAILASTILGAAARAADFFVATTGNNTNNGSANAPWRTLQFAADSIGRGDRVTVRPGSYTGFYLGDKLPGVEPIEFIAEPGVVINQRNSVTPDGINVEATSHVVIDGFTVNNMPRAGVRAAAFPEDNMSHVTIRNIHADRNGVWGIFTGFVDDLVIENNVTSRSIDEHGIYVSNSGDRPIIRGNEIWGNHGSGIHMNGDESQGGDGNISNALITSNRVYNNALDGGGGSGINMDGVQNSRIENNLLYGNAHSGISLYRIDAKEPSTGNVVINNTVFQMGSSLWALNIQDGSIGNTAYNNILLHTENLFQRGAVDISADSLPGFVSDYNLAGSFTTTGGDDVLTLAQWQAQTGQDAHSLAPASIVSTFGAGSHGYDLAAGSVAIDAGTSLLAPAVDFVGVARPQGERVDIGAYEHTGFTADFQRDGDVDGDDLPQWQTRFGATGPVGDANGDFRIDGADVLIWQNQLGSSALAAASALAVPEPSAILLLLGIFSLGSSSIAALCRRGKESNWVRARLNRPFPQIFRLLPPQKCSLRLPPPCGEGVAPGTRSPRRNHPCE